MKPALGIALVGCGRIAVSHLEAIRALPQLGRVVAVVDSELARAQVTAQRYQVPNACDDMRRAFDIADVEAVVICTPNALHAEQSIAALNAGRHVLVEKPMAETAADAARMAAAAERAGRILAVGQTLRHSFPIRYVQDHRNDFGILRAVEVSTCVRWDGPQAPWWQARTPQQGLILSLFAPHALDFVQLIMGADALNVHVEAGRFQNDWQAEDEAMILLRYPEQCLASVHLSYNQRFVLDRRTLHFGDAMLRIEDGDYLWVNDQLVVQPAHIDSGSGQQMGKRDLLQYFRIQFEEFVHAVHAEPHRSVLHHEGLRLTTLIERVIQSANAALAKS